MPMLEFAAIELSVDHEAGVFIKDEVVSVEFAASAGVLLSAVGQNHYRAADALIAGSTGDSWCVSRDRFDDKYVPIAPTKMGEAGRYRNRPIPVWAKQIKSQFQIKRSISGDVLTGDAGDWLLQYAPGDYGVVAQARFDAIYRRAP